MKNTYKVTFDNGATGHYKGFSSSDAAFKASQYGRVVSLKRVSKLVKLFKALAVALLTSVVVKISAGIL